MNGAENIMTKSLRTFMEEHIGIVNMTDLSPQKCTDLILEEFNKIINKVEKDYWKSLPNPYLRGLPMKVSFPKEMDALNKVRKEITKGKKKKKKK